jgi:hypothetical protein
VYKIAKRRHDDVRDDLADLELEALSHLLHHWATNYAARRLKASPLKQHANRTLRRRLKMLRYGVISGVNQGSRGKSRELVPHEISNDEYDVILPAVEQVHEPPRSIRELAHVASWLSIQSVPLSANGSLRRVFPCPQSIVKEVAGDLVSRGRSITQIAQFITGARLGITLRTVANAGRKVRPLGFRLPPRTATQQLLASLFLDVASYGFDKRSRSAAGIILDVLANTGYPPIMLAYLVQIAHSLPSKVTAMPPDVAAIETFCHGLLGKDRKLIFSTLRPSKTP